MNAKGYNYTAAQWMRAAVKTLIHKDHKHAGRTARRMLWQAGRQALREMIVA